MSNKITLRYKQLLDNYNIINRVKDDLKTNTEQELLKKYKSKLNGINAMWSYYSGDDIGHAHTCVRLQIDCIESGDHINFVIED